MLFAEYLGFDNIIFIIYSALKLNAYEIFFINNYSLPKPLLNLSKVLGLNFKRINFTLLDIKIEKELIAFKIDRIDLFELYKNYLKNSVHFVNDEERNRYRNLEKFISKGILAGGLIDYSSPAHFLYLIEVMNWFIKKNKLKTNFFFITNKRPFSKFYWDKVKKYDIELIYYGKIFYHYDHTAGSKTFSKIKKLLLSKILWFPKIREILFNHMFKKRSEDSSKKKFFPKRYMLMYNGRGNLNFKNDGMKSDFEWVLNSKFKL